jgi:hypothetical protein
VFRLTAIAAGAAAFGFAHAIEAAAWRAVFAPAGDYVPWFLNSGRAVALTAACLCLVSLAHALLVKSKRDQLPSVIGNLVVGAVGAMVAILAVNGPGTLFPIAIAIGGLIAAVSCASGAYLGWWLGSAGR